MPGAVGAGFALIQEVTGLVIPGFALLLLKEIPNNAQYQEEHQQIIDATGLIQESGTGLQELYLMRQLAQMAMIMTGMAYGIMTLIIGEEEELLLTEMILAVLV
jgi:hypothetical protein